MSKDARPPLSPLWGLFLFSYPGFAALTLGFTLVRLLCRLVESFNPRASVATHHANPLRYRVGVLTTCHATNHLPRD